MKPSQPIYIVKCGSHTPVGTSASMSAKMIQAGIVRLLSHRSCIDGNDKPIVMGLASYLDESLMGVDRMNALLKPALNEVLQLPDKIKTKDIPIFIGTPEPRPGFYKNSMKKIENKFKGLNLQLIFKGHSASIIAIEQACDLLSSKSEFCIAGGVESYCDLDTLAWLDAQNRLKNSNNKFGFIPGEAAGTLLLTTTPKAKQYKLPIIAEIIAVATTDEENTIDKDTVCKGEGLAEAMNQVLQHLPSDHKISRIFCDLNGERYRTDEYGFAYLKNKEYFDKPDSLTAPVNHWGDIGAATAPNLINLAIESGQKDSFHLVWTSSDAGKRSALLLKITGG